MESVVVPSRQYSRRVGRNSQWELIVDALVVKCLPQPRFERIFNGDCKDWAIGLFEVPHFDSEVVSACDIFGISQELYT